MWYKSATNVTVNDRLVPESELIEAKRERDVARSLEKYWFNMVKGWSK